jgi:hypothetical protein
MLMVAKDEIREKVKLLHELAGNYRRGQVIPWQLIDAICGDHNKEGRYVFDKWAKEMLVPKEIAIRIARGVGVELLTEDEQVRDCPARRRARAFRQTSKAMKELKHVNIHGLSDHGMRIRSLQIASFRGERKALRQGANLLRRTETNPRPKKS